MFRKSTAAMSLIFLLNIINPASVAASSIYSPSSDNNTPSTSANTKNYLKEYDKPDIIDFLKNVFINKNQDGISGKEYNWYFKHLSNGTTPLPPQETAYFVPKYGGYYVGDTSKKVLYLTFDEGYENGYTSPILDVLKKHDVKAAFFVVKPYITSNPELIKRMSEEGHLVCNHSARHPSMPSIKDEEKFKKELSDVEDAYKEVTGKTMPKLFRPPMGKYSELSLNYTKKLGYKTIFWSFAHADWIPEKQPSPEAAKKKILDRTHNGAIILLHAVSKTNSEILDDVITEWKRQGYEIRSLEELK